MAKQQKKGVADTTQIGWRLAGGVYIIKRISTPWLHRHLAETFVPREVHTTLMYFWKIVSTWERCCRQFPN